MPVVRYFLFVGGALLALLFIADACFPKLPAVDDASTAAGDAVSDLSVIRIHSDRKWPERVEFDTSHADHHTCAGQDGRGSRSSGNGRRGRRARAPDDSFAQLQTPKKPEPKLTHKRRIVAKSHRGPPTMLVAQQPRFGFFTNTFW